MSLDPLVSPADLATYLQQDLSEYESEAEYAVALGSAAVRAFCRRTLTLVEDDERTFRWRPEIVLPDPPVIQVSSVIIGDESVEWDRDSRGRLLVDGCSDDDVTVTYSHGYAVLPAEAVMVAVRVAARTFKNPMGRTGYSVDGASYQYPGEVAPRLLTDDEKLMLKPLRLYRVSS